MMADTSALDDMIKTFIKTDDICSIIIKDAENKEYYVPICQDQFEDFFNSTSLCYIK
jgi:hypothetical protein